MEVGKEQRLPPLVCIEPVEIPTERFLPERALWLVQQNEQRMKSRDYRTRKEESTLVHVMLANFGDEALTIPRATVLGIDQGISENIVDKINARSVVSMTDPPKPPRKRKNETLYNKLLQGKPDHLTLEKRQHIEQVLIKK